MNDFCKILCTACLVAWSAQLSAQVVINEFSCANRNIITDNFGEHEDWIELYNTSAATIDLSGYYLSDRANNPTKWQIPAGASIAPNGYKMVWASNRNLTTPNNLHTNFKLTQTANNEYVVLADPSGTIIDSVAIDATRANMSRGRQTNASLNWGIFTDPTPNAANGPDSEFYNNFTATPNIEPSSGGYSGSVGVSITCADPTATIYYTTDGSTPTTGSTPYTVPFTVSNTQVIKAIAVSTDTELLRSFMETNTYFINVTHTIPVISIAGDQVDNLLGGDYWAEPTGSFELFNNNLVLQDEAIGEFNKHGNDSWAYDQRGIDYITRDEFGYDNDIDNEIYATTNRNSFQRIILKAAASDNYPFEGGGAHIRDAFVQTLSQVGNLNLDERSYEPCVLYVNGQYWGVYEMREKVDDADFTKEYYDKDEYDIDFIQTWGGTWNAYGNYNSWDDIRTYILNNDMSVDANYNYAVQYIDPLSLIDYLILNSYIVCADWLNYNTAWWHSTDNTVRWRYALWDMDASFGHYINFTGIPDQSPQADPCNIEVPDLDDPEQHVDILMALSQNQQFRDLYINRYAELNNTTFSCDFMISLLDQLVARMQPEMPQHIARWGGSMSEWNSNVQDIRDFIQTRCTIIDEGIVDCYNVDGPYPITVDVQPPLSGNVTLNSLNIETYPYTGDYFGGTNQYITATANPNWVFDYWEIQNHTITPSINDSIATFAFTTADTLIAHFKPLNPAYLTIIVQNPNTNSLTVNGDPINITDTITIAFSAGDQIDLTALNGLNYTFDGWQLNNHTLVPNNTDPSVSFIINQSDTLIVSFQLITYNITYIVEPADGGTIAINGSNIPSNPYTTNYNINTFLNLSAQINNGYEFTNWTTTNNSLLFPDNNTPNVSFGATTSDTITLHLTALPIPTYTIIINATDSGTVTANGSPATPLPYTITIPQGSPLDLSALASNNYQFDYWQINGILPNPADTTNSSLNFTPTSDLNITAVFSPIVAAPTYTITINLPDPTQGSISINGQIITATTHTITVTATDTLQITAIPANNYTFSNWTSDLTNINTSTPNLIFTTNADGSITVQFKPIVTTNICIPNAFSPNNDQQNDEFRITANNIQSVTYYIYDRWGNQIFQTNQTNINWDGTNKGKSMPIGTYTYYAIITTTDNQTTTKKGSVTLIR